MRGKVNHPALLLLLLSIWIIIPHNWGHDHEHYNYEQEEMHCPLHLESQALEGSLTIPEHAHLHAFEAHCHWCDYISPSLALFTQEQEKPMIDGEPVIYQLLDHTSTWRAQPVASGRGPPRI